MNSRDTLLLACGTSASRKVLRDLFEDSFNLLEASNIYQAQLLLEQNHSCIAAVLLDITVSEKLDTSLLKSIGLSTALREIPVVVLTTPTTSEDVRVGLFELGAIDVYKSDCAPYVLQRRIHNIVELCRHRWNLEVLVDEQASMLRHSNDAMVDVLSSIIEYRNLESGQHILRIRRFTQILLEEIARTCPEYELTEASIRIISSAAALHDIGKIAIPDSILNKPGRLTDEERKVMQTHSITGCRILESLSDIGNEEYLRYAHNICHYHHERWDGNGYPEGICGDDIPICAQVVGLADAYDALTSKRVYKDAYSAGDSASMILNGDCGVFSPQLLDCFKAVTPRFEQLSREYADGQSPRSENFDVTLPSPSKKESIGALRSVQSKYRSMLHYTNATVAEVDLDQGVYHLVYNPDPNLTSLGSFPSFDELTKILLHDLIPTEEQSRFKAMLEEDLPRFFQTGQHQQKHFFHIRSRSNNQAEPYEFTFIRLFSDDNDRRRMLVICRKTEAAPLQAKVSTPAATVSPLVKQCAFLNNAALTMIGNLSDISYLTGYSATEITSRFENELSRLIISQERQSVREKIDSALSCGVDMEVTFRLRHREGHNVWVLCKGMLATDAQGQEYLDCVLMDITRVKTAQDIYNLTLEQYQTILAQTGNIVFDYDLLTDTIVLSDAWEEILGYPPIGKDLKNKIFTHSHFHPDDMSRLMEWLKSLEHHSMPPIEVRIANAEGRYMWFRIRGLANHDADGTAVRILGMLINIDAEKQMTYALQQRADRDTLTKLLNKEAARRQSEECLNSSPNGQCSMLLLDLDNFKQVNDRYGHLFGDAVLTFVAKEITKLFRSQDILARIGGDEFFILMQGTVSQELISSRCTELLSRFKEFSDSNLPDSPLGCSIGVSRCPADGDNYLTLFQRADQALYLAKELGKNRFVFYDEADPAYHSPRQTSPSNTHIDSDEQPGLADNSIVQHAFQRLYTSNDTEGSINEILALVGQQMNVSRVYVFENSWDNKVCNNTYEWCNIGIEPEKDNLQNISYETDIPDYEKNFDVDGIFYVPDVSELPQNLRDILEPQGIKSLLHCAIRDNGVFRGYIGFDECVTKRFWTKEQIQTLTFFSEILGMFLLKEQARAVTALHLENLASILDSQNAWIYVIDPKTCKMHFLNAKTKAIAPQAREGMYCYKALMGLDERCPDCPAEGIAKGRNRQTIVENRHLNLRTLVDATLIRWDGEDACLLTCHELPPEA